MESGKGLESLMKECYNNTFTQERSKNYLISYTGIFLLD